MISRLQLSRQSDSTLSQILLLRTWRCLGTLSLANNIEIEGNESKDQCPNSVWLVRTSHTDFVGFVCWFCRLLPMKAAESTVKITISRTTSVPTEPRGRGNPRKVTKLAKAK